MFEGPHIFKAREGLNNSPTFQSCFLYVNDWQKCE